MAQASVLTDNEIRRVFRIAARVTESTGIRPRQGVGIRAIQKLMGHHDISTTALYCDVAHDILRNAVELV